MQHRFAATTFLALGGLLAWMANFVFVYVFAAVACARGFADASVLGLPIVTLATLSSSLTAGAITLLLVRRGYRLHTAVEMDEHSRFIGFVTCAGAALALVALLLLVMPVMVMSACPRL
ncbi:MAG: hypothetical protein SXG53_08850 [Pseudomonadota bacterium]|nr:hypothetical protein [Pseudomonadota bacterium]